jgi:glycosyltransferase involved in cell wall biosynthesis
MDDVPPARIAIVHDFLLDVRGAERVLEVLCAMFPRADLFTAVYDEEGTEGRFAKLRPQTTFLQRVRPTASTFRALLPLYPYAIESLDLSEYDLVLSSSSAWAHGAIAGPDAVHVCYCHNPFRYAWNARDEILERYPPPVRQALGLVMSGWRQWDTTVSHRIDRYVANSQITQRRIRRYLGRDSEIVHPPVMTSRFSPGPVGTEYAVVSELMGHKHIDVAVAAFNQLRLPLVIVGNGPDARRLERLAGPTVRLTGKVSDAEVAAILARAPALVVTATEEFGIAAVEAQAAGRPVIALREGGALETVVEGTTGVFYDTPDADVLAAAVAAVDVRAFDPAACVANAQRFDVARFRTRITDIVAEELGRSERRRPQNPGSRRPSTTRGVRIRPRRP